MNKTGVFISILILIILLGGFFLLTQKPKSSFQNQTQEGEPTPKTKEGYTGNILAGANSPYLEFNKTDYDKALVSRKIVFLDFYANWCPICRVEAPEIKAGFDGITTDRFIGFRVNFKDSDTDEAEKALAKEFNVPYQHTKIVLKEGKENARFSDQWDKDTFLKEITAIVE